ncbi:MAG: pyridoxamine 5'-phosphate oxidase family protein [Clostridiales bacterium]|nr:pyridoxamine 5'-phosphate oxidase family protein [Candidatus Cacconaster stercorequi]
MRRKDRERTAAFAWEVLEKADYATVSMVTSEGLPYGVPVNLAVDRASGVLYFHCAGAGEKWEILSGEPAVCVSAVSYMAVVPGELTVNYDSAVVHGRAQVVDEEAEKEKALLLLTASLDKTAVDDLKVRLMSCYEQVKIVKIVPDSVTGKQNSMR